MARGENPGQILTLTAPTGVNYDKDARFGHASAGEDLCVGFDGAVVADNDAILGKWVELDQNREMSIDVGGHNGEPLIFRKSADAITPGAGLVGAGGGKVKARDENTVAGLAKVRFVAYKVLETGDNGRVLAIRA